MVVWLVEAAIFAGAVWLWGWAPSAAGGLLLWTLRGLAAILGALALWAMLHTDMIEG